MSSTPPPVSSGNSSGTPSGPPSIPSRQNPPKPVLPARKKKSKTPWIIGGIIAAVIALGLLIVAAVIVFALANKDSDTPRHRNKDFSELEVNKREKGFRHLDEGDDHDHDRNDDDYAQLIDESDFYDDEYLDDGDTDRAWNAYLQPGNYIMHVTVNDPNNPGREYKCHIEFRYTGSELKNCAYHNDSFGTSLAVKGKYDSDSISFSGSEGGTKFSVDLNHTGGTDFTGTTSYGSTVCTASGILSPA